MKSHMKLFLFFWIYLFLTLPASSLESSKGGPDFDAFEEAVEFSEEIDFKNVVVHQERLQTIAYENNGNRQSGFTGYDQSVDYVTSQLLNAGYSVELQIFEIPLWSETAPPLFEQILPIQKLYTPDSEKGFFTMKNSTASDLTSTIQAVDIVLPPAPDANSSTSGCEVEDFEGFIRGNIALIQRGTCPFITKIENAQNAGASAVIIFNEGQPGRTDAFRISMGKDSVIPGFFAHFDIGDELYRLSQQESVSVHMTTSSVTEYKEVANVLAETPESESNRVVMIGAHLDSAQEGPGINDNGSGSAAVLETALQLIKKDDEYENKVRFAFWAAEELGLVGSRYYLDNLTEKELKRIGYYLNFDMIGSPNFVRFVFRGDGPSTVPGSKNIETFFTSYFKNFGLPTELIPPGGGSDHASFMNKGIPIGGLFTGAGGLKTEEQALIFGGEAGKAYDENYHTSSDTLENINLTVEEEMVRAIATAVYAGAENQIHIPKREKRAKISAIQPLFDFEYAGPNLLK